MIGTDEPALQRLALEVAVDQLTKPGTEVVGDGRRAGVPSLLDQLDDALTSRTGPGAAVPVRARAPIRLDVADLFAEVEEVVGKCSRPTLGERVRAWSAALHSETDPEVVAAAVERVERWVDLARHALDPRPAWRLPRSVPCPACGVDVERTTNSEGREVLSGPLEVQPRAGLRCVVCGARWTPDVLEAMAQHIARQTEREIDAIDEQ